MVSGYLQDDSPLYWGDYAFSSDFASTSPLGGPSSSGGSSGLISDLVSGVVQGVNQPSNPSLSQVLTDIVNAAEMRLKQNLANWQTQGIDSTTAIARGWDILNSMVAALVKYGAQGQKSAAERDRRIDPSMLRWDYVGWYIDPITGGATVVQPLPATVTASLANSGNPSAMQLQTAGMNLSNPWVIATVVIVAALLLKRKG